MTSTTSTLLAGIRVLDASRMLAGPFCGQVLGDLGAEVLKVERPGSGDDRGWGPPFLTIAGEPTSAYYLSCNRNKRGLTLDLAQPEGVQLFYQLVRHSDILLENFRSASADKLGLSPHQLLKANPRLIVCSISGFGRTGPMRHLPGYDFAIQALSGLMSITGPALGPPCKTGVAVTDILTGLNAAIAVLAWSARPGAFRPRLSHRPRPARSRRGCPGERGPGLSVQRPAAASPGQRSFADRAVSAFCHGRQLSRAGGGQR